MFAYYQVASAHLYISCVTLWWEVICLQEAEERVHGMPDRKPCMLGDASLHIYPLKKRGIFKFKDGDGNIFFSSVTGNTSSFNSYRTEHSLSGFSIDKDLSSLT